MRGSIVIGAVPVLKNGKVKFKVVKKPLDLQDQQLEAFYYKWNDSPVLAYDNKITNGGAAIEAHPSIEYGLQRESFLKNASGSIDHIKRITVIIPALNEEISIGSIIIGARQFADRVIVIDDGSTDRTAEVAALGGAEVIRHPFNKGKGAALKTGFEAVKNTDIIVTIDADGQHDPQEIPKITAPIISGEADMVVGSRYINGNGRNTPFYRRIGQTVLDAFTNMNSGLKNTDTQSGFRAFASSTVPKFRFEQARFGIESEMLTDAANAQLKVKEVEIGVRYDVDCSTENSVSHGIRVLTEVLHDIELRRPLFYFTAPGIVLAGIGIVMGLGFLRDFILGGSLQFGPTLLMILLTLVGAFMAFTGIILHSMSKLLLATKK